MPKGARLWRSPTVAEIAEELRARIGINKREATRAGDGRCVSARVFERTAAELSRLLFWITAEDEETKQAALAAETNEDEE